jgi:hypothetical protein
MNPDERSDNERVTLPSAGTQTRRVKYLGRLFAIINERKARWFWLLLIFSPLFAFLVMVIGAVLWIGAIDR